MKLVREEAAHSASPPWKLRSAFFAESLESSLSLELPRGESGEQDVCPTRAQREAATRLPVGLCVSVDRSRETLCPVEFRRRQRAASAVVWRTDGASLVDARALLRDASRLKCSIRPDGQVVHDWQCEEEEASLLLKELQQQREGEVQAASPALDLKSDLGKTLPDAPPPVSPSGRRFSSFLGEDPKSPSRFFEAKRSALQSFQLRRQCTLAAAANDWQTPVYGQPVLNAAPICCAPKPPSFRLLGGVSSGSVTSRQATPRVSFRPRPPSAKAPLKPSSGNVALQSRGTKKDLAATRASRRASPASMHLAIQGPPRRRVVTSATSLVSEIESFKTQISSDMEALVKEMSENAARIEERLRRRQLLHAF